MEITFIQTGGAIDKDYPKTTRGYALKHEIQVLGKNLIPPITYGK
jgi:hypothetical protein